MADSDTSCEFDFEIVDEEEVIEQEQLFDASNDAETAQLREEWFVLDDNTFTRFQDLCNEYSNGGFVTSERQTSLEMILQLLDDESSIAQKLFERAGSMTSLVQVAASESATAEMRAQIVRLLILHRFLDNGAHDSFNLSTEGLLIFPQFTNALKWTIQSGFPSVTTLKFLENFASRLVVVKDARLYENVLACIADALLIVIESWLSEPNLRARALIALEPVVTRDVRILERTMGLPERLVSAIPSMPLTEELRGTAIEIIRLISQSPLRIERILVSGDAEAVVRVFLRDPEDGTEEQPEMWIMRGWLATSAWAPQLSNTQGISSDVRRSLLFEFAESKLALEVFSEHNDLLAMLAQQCTDNDADVLRLKVLMKCPAFFQGVPCERTLCDLLARGRGMAEMHYISTIINLNAHGDTGVATQVGAEVPRRFFGEDCWTRLENLIRMQGMADRLVGSRTFTKFLKAHLELETSQNNALAFTRTLMQEFFEGESSAPDNSILALIDCYVHALRLTAGTNNYAELIRAIPFVDTRPQAFKFIHGLIKHSDFQRSFREDSQWWTGTYPRHAGILTEWSFRAVKAGLAVIPIAEWLDATTCSSITEPPHIEYGRFIVFCMAALENRSYARAAEAWLSKALRAQIVAPPSGAAKMLDDLGLVRRLNEWWMEAQHQSNVRLFNLLTDVGRTLAGIFLVEWNTLLMPLGTRADVAAYLQCNRANPAVERLFKWHGIVPPDRFLLELLQAMGDDKVRLPEADEDRDRQLSSPWFLNRVLEHYGNRTVELTVRRGASRVLYRLTLGEGAQSQVLGRVHHLATSSKWVQDLLWGLLDTFSDETVQEADGIVKTFLRPVFGSLELDQDCQHILTALCQRLHQFCQDNVDVAQTYPSLLWLIHSQH